MSKDLLNKKFSECRFCAIDFETTGLSPFNSEIIEIGAIEMQNFEIGKRFDTLIRPMKQIPKEVAKITGIDNDMVMEQPLIEEIKNPFLEFLGDAILVEHSRGIFDIKFFTHYFKPTKQYYYVNTLEIAKKLFPMWNKYDLVSMCEKLNINIKVSRHHKAVDDAKLTMLCLIKFLKMLEERGSGEINSLERRGVLHVLERR